MSVIPGNAFVGRTAYGMLGMDEVITVASPEEATRAYRFLVRRKQSRERRRESSRQDAIARLKKAVAEVAPGFSVERVYLYGSLLSGRWHRGSDVDLAVEGDLPFADLLALWSELDRRLDWEVDVRELTGLPFAGKVRAEGMVVYERRDPHSHKSDRGCGGEAGPAL